MICGCEIWLPIDVVFGSPPEIPIQSTSNYECDVVNRSQKMYHHVRRATKQKRQLKEIYDKNIWGPSYKKGNRVWLYSPAIPKGKFKKFHTNRGLILLKSLMHIGVMTVMSRNQDENLSFSLSVITKLIYCQTMKTMKVNTNMILCTYMHVWWLTKIRNPPYHIGMEILCRRENDPF